MAVSCFTRTLEREMNEVDFSWRTFTAGLCLLQRRRVAPPQRPILTAFFTNANVILFARLFLVGGGGTEGGGGGRHSFTPD